MQKVKIASMVGLEPTTPGLEVRCAIHCATLTDGNLRNFSRFQSLAVAHSYFECHISKARSWRAITTQSNQIKPLFA